MKQSWKALTFSVSPYTTMTSLLRAQAEQEGVSGQEGLHKKSTDGVQEQRAAVLRCSGALYSCVLRFRLRGQCSCCVPALRLSLPAHTTLSLFSQIAETYAFLPREAVTRFLMSCTECQKRMHFNSNGLEPKGKGKQTARAEPAVTLQQTPLRAVSDCFVCEICLCQMHFLTLCVFSVLLQQSLGNGLKSICPSLFGCCFWQRQWDGAAQPSSASEQFHHWFPFSSATPQSLDQRHCSCICNQLITVRG